jgi:hypothetical protein
MTRAKFNQRLSAIESAKSEIWQQDAQSLIKMFSTNIAKHPKYWRENVLHSEDEILPEIIECLDWQDAAFPPDLNEQIFYNWLNALIEYAKAGPSLEPPPTLLFRSSEVSDLLSRLVKKVDWFERHEGECPHSDFVRASIEFDKNLIMVLPQIVVTID